MNQKHMIQLCKEKGFNFSIPLIYRYGIKEGFLIKVSETGREKYQVNEKKFLEWLDNGPIPKDYISLASAEKEFGISFMAIKYRLLKSNKEIVKLGIGREKLFYAKRSDIESVITEYHKRSKKEKSDD